MYIHHTYIYTLVGFSYIYEIQLYVKPTVFYHNKAQYYCTRIEHLFVFLSSLQMSDDDFWQCTRNLKMKAVGKDGEGGERVTWFVSLYLK